MGNPFTSPSIGAAYNATPPSDDGANTSTNEVTWAKHKTKLSDPVKALVESAITNTNSAFAKVVGGGGVTNTGVNYTVQSSDQGKLVRATAASITLTTPDATSELSPFVFGFLNDTSGTITLDGSGAQTIDGEATITVPAGKGGWLFTDSSNWYSAGLNFDVTPKLPRGHIGGLQISNNGTDSDHDIDIAVGECRATGHDANLVISSATTKRIDASWVTGSGNGGMASAVSLTADTTYHLFLVDDGAGTTDAGFDTSLTATNLLSDTGGSFYRRIGSVITDGTSNILAFSQHGDEFLLADPPLDVNSASVTTTASLHGLTVPTGIKVRSITNLRIATTDGFVYASSPDANDEAPSGTAAPLATAARSSSINESQGGLVIRTDTSGQIRLRSTIVGGVDTWAATLGWLDDLGRYS